MTLTQQIITIAVVVAATVLTRFLPYIAFPEGRPIPKVVTYLGKVLAPAVFGLLFVYCLRNVSFVSGNFGLPEIISLAFVALLYFRFHGMILPIAGGTILYMILVQTVFA